jgi:hypothetical protein
MHPIPPPSDSAVMLFSPLHSDCQNAQLMVTLSGSASRLYNPRTHETEEQVTLVAVQLHVL